MFNKGPLTNRFWNARRHGGRRHGGRLPETHPPTKTGKESKKTVTQLFGN